MSKLDLTVTEVWAARKEQLEILCGSAAAQYVRLKYLGKLMNILGAPLTDKGLEDFWKGSVSANSIHSK